MQVSITFTLVKVGPRWVATTNVGGFLVRGTPAPKAEPALKALLWKLSGNGTPDDDAELGIALLVAGSDLSTEMQRQALPAANPTAGGGSSASGSSSAESGEEQEANAGAVEWMRSHPDQTYQDYLDEVAQREFDETFRPARPGAPPASST